MGRKGGCRAVIENIRNNKVLTQLISGAYRSGCSLAYALTYDYLNWTLISTFTPLT